jgi:protein-L-isoaspartate(D-aspartate) O-methyltransferase
VSGVKRAIPALIFVVALSGCSDNPSTGTADPTSASAAISATTVAAEGTSDVATTSAPADVHRADRTKMVDLQIVARLISDEPTIAAMRAVPRHEFVPSAYVDQAYNDNPLPIGHGQTISQPYIVALMTQELGVEPGDKVLEIGTGSGYQAAVLAEMGVEVYTIEIIDELAVAAADRLQLLGYDVATLSADGYFGWEEHAPFDAIVVTAAPDHLPQLLVDQLAPGGRVVIPIGPIGAVQTLWRFEVDDDGEVIGENLGAVRFVPFTRAE